MGCFSGDVSRVANTRIFARETDTGKQVLVIQLDYSADKDIGLILPLPTSPGTTAEQVELRDLSNYPGFFEDLANGFPIARSGSFDASGAPAQGIVTGSDNRVSFLPALSDFENVEPQYRISDEIWQQLPEYNDNGFVLFKLNPNEHTVGPFAIEFPTRNQHLLYFPTAQVINNKFEENTYFDHDLFCQANVGWMRSYDAARSFMDLERAGDVIDPNFRAERFTVLGIHPNSDIVLNPTE